MSQIPLNGFPRSDLAFVLRYLHPKAYHHFLVRPQSADITNLFALTREHAPLLEDMYKLALDVIKSLDLNLNETDFLIGFRLSPPSKNVYMHVISNDFFSFKLKYAHEWKQFHSHNFLPYKSAYGTLLVRGHIKPLTEEKLLAIEMLPLKCNQCNFKAQHMQSLKDHLLQHWIKRTKPTNETKSNDVTDEIVVDNDSFYNLDDLCNELRKISFNLPGYSLQQTNRIKSSEHHNKQNNKIVPQ